MNIQQISENHILHTYNRFPLTFEKGEGVWLYTDQGEKYLDAASGIAVSSLGHNHPALNQAICQQAGKLLHISNYYYNIPNTLLAEQLVQLSGLSRVFFCNSGAEANEGAIKLARKFGKKSENPDKYQILSMVNSFHGRTLAAITATGQEKFQTSFTPLPEGFQYIELNNLKELKEKINQNTAAVIIEPIQGESGILPVDLEYLKLLRSLCDKNNVLLIFDEVQTGMGRTGKWFAFQHYPEVVPDVVTLAKGLAGGLPIGAMLVGEKAKDVLVPGDHASTFGGNPVSSAAACAVIKIVEQEKLLDHVAEMGNYLKEKLFQLKEKHPDQILDIRGQGLLIGIETKVDHYQLVDALIKQHILTVPAGNNVTRIIPPFIIQKAEIDQIINNLDEIFLNIAVT
ncbi:MAG: aspartate aminotransferase family protein [Spirochaetes bacterium]|nr:aspartate aminotransferase family protein [Spirochaetota bacterium]